MAKKSNPVGALVLRKLARDNGLDSAGKIEEVLKRLTDAGHFPIKESPTLFPDPKPRVGVSSQTLFLQLPVENIGRYFKRGVFYPLSLELDEDIKRQRQPDVLTKFPDYLVLAPGTIDYLEESEVLVELQLQASEQNKLQSFNDIFLYPEPLPISRVKQILFSGEKARTRFVASANTFKDYFVPDIITGVIPDSIASLAQPENVAEHQADSPIFISENQRSKWSEILAKYDRILGLFAYLRNSSVVLSATANAVQEYPNDALAALHLLNEAAPKQPSEKTALFNYLLRRSNPTSDYESSPSRRLFFETVAAIYANETPSYSWAATRITEIGASLPTGADRMPLRNALKTFEALSQPGQTTPQAAIRSLKHPKTVGSQESSLDIPFVSLVLLGRYSNRERTNTDKQVALNFLRTANLRAAEVGPLLAMLGLYYGYERMPRQDENAAHEFTPNSPLQPLAQPYGRLHFRMDLPLDRAIVECCFQFAVTNEATNNDLAFLQLANMAKASPDSPYKATTRTQVSTVFGVPVFRDEVKSLPPIEPVKAPQSQMLPPSTASILRAAYPSGKVPVRDSIVAVLAQLRPFQVTLPVDMLAQLMDSLPAAERELLLSLLQTTHGGNQVSGTAANQDNSPYWKK